MKKQTIAQLFWWTLILVLTISFDDPWIMFGFIFGIIYSTVIDFVKENCDNGK